MQYVRRRVMEREIASTMVAPRIAEVGVFRARHAKSLHALFQPSEFYLIDPWGQLAHTTYDDYGLGPDKWEAIYQTNVKFWSEVPGATLHRALSEDAAPCYPDHHFDYVYLDGNHAYSHIQQDIDLWLPKVKVGGFLAGHDYDNPDVQRAVFKRMGLPHLSSTESPSSWAVRV